MTDSVRDGGREQEAGRVGRDAAGDWRHAVQGTRVPVDSLSHADKLRVVQQNVVAYASSTYRHRVPT